MKPRALLPIGLLTASMLAYAAQGITLKHTPKAGEKFTYKVVGTFDLPGMGEAKLTGNSVDETVKVDGDIVETKTSATQTSVSIPGIGDQPVPDATQTVKSKLDGSVVSVDLGSGKEAGNSAAMRIARITSIVFPGKETAIDATWTVEGKKDEKLDIPGYKLEYKLLGEEKFGTWDTYKISVKGSETEAATPTKIEGTYWVEKSTGTHVRSLTKLTDAVFDANFPALTGTMEITRQP